MAWIGTAEEGEGEAVIRIGRGFKYSIWAFFHYLPVAILLFNVLPALLIPELRRKLLGDPLAFLRLMGVFLLQVSPGFLVVGAAIYVLVWASEVTLFIGSAGLRVRVAGRSWLRAIGFRSLRDRTIPWEEFREARTGIILASRPYCDLILETAGRPLRLPIGFPEVRDLLELIARLRPGFSVEPATARILETLRSGSSEAALCKEMRRATGPFLRRRGLSRWRPDAPDGFNKRPELQREFLVEFIREREEAGTA